MVCNNRAIYLHQFRCLQLRALVLVGLIPSFLLVLHHPSILPSTKHVAWCIKHEVFTHRLKKWSRDYNYCNKKPEQLILCSKSFYVLDQLFLYVDWVSVFDKTTYLLPHFSLFTGSTFQCMCLFYVCWSILYLSEQLHHTTVTVLYRFCIHPLRLEWLELAFVPFWLLMTFSLTSTYQTYTGAVRCLHCWM